LFFLGTGGVIEHIREIAGYTGIVDILDANLPMLVKAENKDLKLRLVILFLIDQVSN